MKPSLAKDKRLNKSTASKTIYPVSNYHSTSKSKKTSEKAIDCNLRPTRYKD